ncbi:glycosyltransferase family 2 protein [Microbacterium sp. zg.Y1090]|uniref:glycosyltransferase family 2 protein n=1 Tax=Microbacterium TaxID=33882 RepID=UPI00214B3569|nr:MULTISPECIES: glycosyltransferase family 2 protein [unclassified Microbacterium]MCR2813597.1 glycosyltransferase family 2 protein [Microbacterium sp. zg.Y1084]MCR2818071.1 glycosyltransferase family 2 protein [Microbacterium sp. zg.Y1090]MDL5486588.1 glycosyltransferase family 2 protein [Microbacterium sp. zg-Y1211]WIM27771.1 glycosyltransferase family 2 protein [Microbacterium sp. zg-Y1090]
MEQYATVVISYRRPELVAAVLEALARQSPPPAHVVVVDNAGDLSERVLTDSKLADRCTLVRRPDNPGYSAAVNEARVVAAGLGLPHLLVLTHDARFEDDLVAQLAQAFQDDRVAAAAPVLRLASDPARVFSAGGRLTAGGRAWNTTVPASHVEPYPVDWVDGAIVLYDVAALDAIGGMDERYFLYFEDVDTAWRLARSGRRTVIVPTAIAYQQPGAHPLYLGVRNMTLFAHVAGVPSYRSIPAVLRRVAEEAAWAVLHARRPALGAAWRGWRDGRRGLSGHPPEGRA